MMRKMGWQVDEEMNRDKTGEADGINLEADAKDEVMHVQAYVRIHKRSVLSNEETVGGRERVTTDEGRVMMGVELRLRCLKCPLAASLSRTKIQHCGRNEANNCH